MRIALAATLLVATGCSGFHKGMTWQITLSEPPRSRNVDVEAWDLDLFDTPSDVIRTIHDGGTQVICYFSSGTFEPCSVTVSPTNAAASEEKSPPWAMPSGVCAAKATFALTATLPGFANSIV